MGLWSHDLNYPHQWKVIRGRPRCGRDVHPHSGKRLRWMYPDAIEREERLPGRPGARPGRLPEVRAEMTECMCQEELFIDVPEDHGEAVRVPHNRLSKALHLEPPLPRGQSKMGRDDAEHIVADRDIDVKGTPRLTRRDVQVNAPHREDRQAREQHNPIVPSRPTNVVPVTTSNSDTAARSWISSLGSAPTPCAWSSWSPRTSALISRITLATRVVSCFRSVPMQPWIL